MTPDMFKRDQITVSLEEEVWIGKDGIMQKVNDPTRRPKDYAQVKLLPAGALHEGGVAALCPLMTATFMLSSFSAWRSSQRGHTISSSGVSLEGTSALKVFSQARQR